MPKGKQYPGYPLPMSTDMVQAYRDGFKNQMRRMKGLEHINEDPEAWKVIRPLRHYEPVIDGGIQEFPGVTPNSYLALKNPAGIQDMGYMVLSCPFGVPGDELWVREACCLDEKLGWVYRADVAEDEVQPKWKPSMHAPYEATRFKPKILHVRPERLQSITKADAILEGIRAVTPGEETFYWDYVLNRWQLDALHSFKTLWISIYGELMWEKNPWVWRILISPAVSLQKQ